MKLLRVFAFLLVGALLSSCGSPTYPKDRVAESVVKLCRDEYKIDVKAQLKGTTLGVLASIPGLLDVYRRSAGSSATPLPVIRVEGNYVERSFGFRIFARGDFAKAQKKEETNHRPKEPEEPIKKLQQVLTALNRVCLSTDAPIDFYQMIARDTGPENLDFIFSTHLMDSKRMQFSAISIGDAQFRSQFDGRIQPEALARLTVSGFLRDLRRVPLSKLLSAYTASSKRFGELLPKILLAAVELRGKEQKLPAEMTWPVRQIDPRTALVYVPLAAIDETGALLFSVEIRENVGALLDIERLEDGKLPKRHEALGPPERWGDFFYIEPLSMPTFLAGQVARRVTAGFELFDPKDKKSQTKPATVQDIARTLVETAAYVVQSYDFKDFREISVVDALQGTQWTVPAAGLPLYRRRNPPELKPVP